MNLIALPIVESNNKDDKSGEVTFIPNHGPFRQKVRDSLEEHSNERKKNLRREMYCYL